MKKRACAGVAMALAALLHVSEAASQSKAAAEALFDQGKQLLEQKKYDEACPKFEQSQQIDPGIGTLLYLGECYEKAGRTASAWATFREAASAARAAGQARRQKIGEERAKLLEGKLSRLSINVPQTSLVEGLKVTRDGEPVESSVWGVPIPVDPGQRLIEATAPGKKAWSKRVEIGADGANAVVEIPALEDDESAIAAPAAAPAPAPAPAAPAPPPSGPGHLGDEGDAQTGGSSQKTLGLIVGGVGLLGIGVGSFFGLQAASKNSDAEEQCPRGNKCDTREGVTLTEDAKDAANISTIAFGVGGVALAGGLVLFLTAPSSDEEPAKAAGSRLMLAPVVGPRGGGVSMGGTF